MKGLFGPQVNEVGRPRRARANNSEEVDFKKRTTMAIFKGCMMSKIMNWKQQTPSNIQMWEVGALYRIYDRRMSFRFSHLPRGRTCAVRTFHLKSASS